MNAYGFVSPAKQKSITGAEPPGLSGTSEDSIIDVFKMRFFFFGLSACSVMHQHGHNTISKKQR